LFCGVNDHFGPVAKSDCGKAAKGSNDWRNGVPLCATHHVEFDADLFAIHPETLQIVLREGVDRESLGISVEVLSVARARPHVEALRWRFGQFASDEGREAGEPVG
jgi:putative restriction endonuclease